MSATNATARHVKAALLPLFVNTRGEWRPWVLHGPNAICWMRIAFAPVLIVIALLVWLAVITDRRWVPLAFLLVGWLLDAIDGWWARKVHAVSEWGGFLDGLADKLLVGSVVLYIVIVGAHHNHLDLVSFLIMALREFCVTYFRAQLPKDQYILPTTPLAKWKMFFQVVLMGCFLVGPYLVDHSYPWEVSLTAFNLFVAVITGLTWYQYTGPQGKEIAWERFLPASIIRFCMLCEDMRIMVTGK